MTTEKERAYDDLRVLYQAILEDIKLYKNQQWLATYYAFGIYVVLSSLLSQESLKSIWFPNIAIIILSIFVIVGGIWILNTYQDEIIKSRNQKFVTIRSMSPIIQNILRPDEAKYSENTIVIILKSVMILGGIFVISLSIC
jgi:hypothetical protein